MYRYAMLSAQIALNGAHFSRFCGPRHNYDSAPRYPLGFHGAGPARYVTPTETGQERTAWDGEVAERGAADRHAS
jgi:hypothetical protein